MVERSGFFCEFKAAHFPGNTFGEGDARDDGPIFLDLDDEPEIFKTPAQGPRAFDLTGKNGNDRGAQVAVVVRAQKNLHEGRRVIVFNDVPVEMDAAVNASVILQEEAVIRFAEGETFDD